MLNLASTETVNESKIMNQSIFNPFRSWLWLSQVVRHLVLHVQASDAGDASQASASQSDVNMEQLTYNVGQQIKPETEPEAEPDIHTTAQPIAVAYPYDLHEQSIVTYITRNSKYIIKYIGTLHNGRRHGHGKLVFYCIGKCTDPKCNGPDESVEELKYMCDVCATEVFVGSFVNGRKTYGTLRCVNGDVYTGEFKNNRYHGIGTHRWYATNNIYSGEWRNGEIYRGIGSRPYESTVHQICMK